MSQDSGRLEKHVVDVKFNVVVLKSRNNDKALCPFSGPLIHRFAVKVQSQAVKNGSVKILSDWILNSPFKLLFKQPSSFCFSSIIIAVVYKKKTLLYAEASNSTFFEHLLRLRVQFFARHMVGQSFLQMPAYSSSES